MEQEKAAGTEAEVLPPPYSLAHHEATAAAGAGTYEFTTFCIL